VKVPVLLVKKVVVSESAQPGTRRKPEEGGALDSLWGVCRH